MRLVIRKVQFAPEKPGPQPSAETTRHFLMSDRSLHLEASLDKEVCERVVQVLQRRSDPGGRVKPRVKMASLEEADLATVESCCGLRVRGKKPSNMLVLGAHW